jgi:hypothetical protein
MPSLLQPSLRQAELKDLLLCWSRFGTAEKHIPSPLHHPLRHGDERSSGRSWSSDNSPRNDQMVPLRTIARVAVAEEIIAGGVLSAILTTSPRRFSAAIALAKVIGLVVPSTAR